ncbi:peptidylprolyl isomerase [bacterium]|nr:peptidylprolyl isomerase [bacterium]
MNTKKLLTIIALSSVLLTGCGTKDKDAIILVNGEKITKEDFDNSFKTLTNSPIQESNSPVYLILKDRVVNELVVRKLLEQEIEKRKIKVTEEEEQEAILKLVNRYGSKEKLHAALRQSGVSNDKFKKDLRDELKMRKLISMLGSYDVTEGDVKKFYKENPDKFKYPEKVRASHILISANPKDISAYFMSDKNNANITKAELDKKIEKEIKSQKAKAEKILAEVKANPKGFEKYAKEYSEDVASGQKGGDLGFFAYEDMVEPFSKAAFSLKPNKVSNLVQSDYGYHIIMVTDRAKAGTISFDEAKDDIKQYMLADNKVKLLEALISNLKNNAKIEFIDDKYKPQKPQKTIEEVTKETAK